MFLLDFLTAILLDFIMTDIGDRLGYRFGSARLSHSQGRQPASEIRALGDFCTPWLWAIPLILAAATLSVNLYFSAATRTLSHTSHALAGPALVVASLLLVTALQEPIWARWIANSPNALVTNDAVTTQRANDCSKALVIARGINMLWLLCMMALEDTMMFWTDYRPVLSGGVNDILIIGSFFVTGFMFIAIVGLMTVLPTGHMGGRLTGWWWQRRPERRERAAAEGG